VDRSQHTYTALDELRQIQAEVRHSISFDHLRRCFERVQAIRRAYADDFETQLLIAEVQDEIIDRARGRREEAAAILTEDPPPKAAMPSKARKAEEDS